MRRRALPVLAALAAFLASPVSALDRPVNAPLAERRADEPPGLKYAIFAGGCFWGVEGVFSHVKGVTSVVTGYHGGTRRQATYDLVSSGMTDHAEAVRITYDPAIIRYDELLRILFSVVTDPTQLNRQGPDTGTHYRSAIVPLSEEQRLVALGYLAQMRESRLWRRPIVVRIERHRQFYPAEAYHQDFMAKNPRHPYIQAWDVAKVNALRQMFPARYKRDFTTN
ncbi:MAG TPA: peptide-methionine (S)-S-oxide reductase MsrA [Novosphingobium sp.]|nr:peptide-methionine (S)-S-oxide reductase MsrA [Novosphingobium sp.]HMP56756.1 peptide-methionine (S)-S-oxide reductase MsrA [Novosphingobium sp.]